MEIKYRKYRSHEFLLKKTRSWIKIIKTIK